MAPTLQKNFKLIALVAVILIVGIGGYYLFNLKKGPYQAADFISISYQWGVGDTLVNSYHSATGAYQYLDNKDSLVKKALRLNANHMIFLHSRASEIDIWGLPSVIANQNADLKSDRVLRYELTFNYEQKTKKIVFMTDYNKDPKIANAAAELQELVAQILAEAESRSAHP